MSDIVNEAAAEVASRLGMSLPTGDPPFDQDRMQSIARRQLLPSVRELAETAESIVIEETDK